ncbi:helix-turn-helix domain-containing protein [Flavobacterium humidisoli]|uniref:Helix-turn-helix domain-containing protein n=1 Tax=Flavobacterium humidisoli TaxID=2937442 RepID=A0ABY4LY48_9FLAO|nr:helix-turn-helix domain-containing protein [Flavobacterium humidisoli]UPZ18024.1 helix-turn-helix domain-containing protein [Flavobacterium humidisoli]
MKQNLLFVMLLCAFSFDFGFAQKKEFKASDSLKNKSYTYLDDQLYNHRKDSSKASVYLLTYLKKAKNEKNWKEIIFAYQNYLHHSPDKMRIIYADSMIYTAKKAGDNTLLGSSYLSKGIVYYGRKDYENAFQNYIRANNYISRSNDKYLINKVKYHMAQIKYYLGFYDEALALFNDCLTYFKVENTSAYLNTLHSIGVCYNRIGNYGLCSEINRKGIYEGKSLGLSDMEIYFIHSDGINEYFKKNYQLAISKLESVVEKIKDNRDFANEAVGYFYIGKSFWSVRNKDQALPYLLKVDKAFQEKKYIRPDLRESYELLITYYKNKKDLSKQLYYIDQLLRADTILNNTYKYLVTKIHKNYDTKELLIEKEKIQNENKKIHKELVKEKHYDLIFAGIILVLFTVSFYLNYRHQKNKKFYKKKFDELMLELNTKPKDKKELPKEKSPTLDIPSETITSILNGLQSFEDSKKFLGKDLRLNVVANMLHTNSKYLYKVISHYKGKRFVEYINDLKINYIIALLNDDRMSRKYSNSALAEEAGFSSTQQFALAFKQKTEMPVNFFIEQLSK